ncbi:MAG: hypothetical protein HBSAPP03_26260 [Phycisphaerae bacterium]|nr:MAG: hypothetical protein HBSAPP03_26260 [Phycisphaerae bacterium]
MTRTVQAILGMFTASSAIAQTPPPAEPDLDVLLGLRRPGEVAPADPNAAQRERDRLLSPAEITDEFEKAVVLMDESSRRLAEAKDPGLDTQRLQEDTLRHLDKLIADAQQRSRSRQQRQRQQQQQQQQSSQQQQQQSSQSGSTPTDSTQGGTPSVPRQDGQLNTPRAADAASWGNLPEHVRQALTQGLSDRFSSLYQQMTEQYYRRLAEEPKPTGRPR